MWRVYRIALYDFVLTWKDRSVIFWIFAMPLAFMIFFGLSFGGSGGVSSRVRITIENRDGGFISAALIAELQDEKLSIVEADSLAEGGRAVRTLVIPSDFTEKVLRRERVDLLLRKEAGSNNEAGEAASIAIVRGLMRVVSGLIELEASELSRGRREFTVQDDSLHGNLWNLVGANAGAMETLQVRLDSLQARDPLVTVDASVAGRKDRPPSGFQYSVPGNLIMFVLMSMVFSGTGITMERASGILRRIGMTPVGKGEVVLGKLLGRMGVTGIQILFLLLVGRFLFRISLGNDPAALILLMLAFSFCAGSFSILFGSFFTNPDQVTGFAIITTLVMSALGGCWWPIEVVSRPFRVVAYCLPTGWAISGLHRIISFGYGIMSVVPHLMMLTLFGLVFIAFASRKLRWEL